MLQQLFKPVLLLENIVYYGLLFVSFFLLLLLLVSRKTCRHVYH